MTMYRVRFVSTGWTGGPGLNTFYFENSLNPSTSSSDQAATCVELVRAGFFGISGLYPPTWTGAVTQEVDMIDPTTGMLTSTYSVPPVAAVVGTGSAGFAPLAVGLCPALVTNSIVGGQRIRGRAFLSPIAGGGEANGTPSAAQLGWAAQIVGMLIGGTGGPPRLVVWHRPRKARAATATLPALAAAPGSQHYVASVSVKDTFSVLRSRRD